MDEKITIYAVVGPTASGKSTLALELAERYGGEIVSCDSMQIYKRMDIGTAKPTFEERARVPHHMVDVVEPTESFSCADYVREADRLIRDIHKRTRLPFVCGGTGLYLDALLRGEDFKPELTDASLRAELIDFAEKNGAESLHSYLESIDPESAADIHPNNVKRVARAIEIYKLSGMKKSDIDRQSKEGERRFDVRCVGLTYSDRARLYERIEKRVDAMLVSGLVEETKRLAGEGVFDANATAAQAIGYKELLPYLDGKVSLAEATESLKTATRRYAKRQMTWFSSKPYVNWVDVCESKKQKTFEEIVNITEKHFFC